MFQENEERVFSSLGEIEEEILEVEGREPQDRRRLEHKEWTKTLNQLYLLYNSKMGFKAYKTIK